MVFQTQWPSFLNVFQLVGSPSFCIWLAMMTPYVPFPHAMNVISGAAEIVGGIAVHFPRLRSAAGWGTIALLLAVFPANIHVALHGWDGVTIPAWGLLARRPLQVALVAWVYFSCLSTNERNPLREQQPDSK